MKTKTFKILTQFKGIAFEVPLSGKDQVFTLGLLHDAATLSLSKEYLMKGSILNKTLVEGIEYFMLESVRCNACGDICADMRDVGNIVRYRQMRLSEKSVEYILGIAK